MAMESIEDEDALARENELAEKAEAGSALIQLVREGDTAGEKALIAQGAWVDHVDERSWSAAMWAAQRGDADGLSALIDAGANLAKRDFDRFNALDLAVAKGHIDCIQALLSAKRNGRAAIDVDVADDAGHTALMVAIARSQVESALALIRAGADLEARDGEGQTALLWACGAIGREPYPAAAKALVVAGADVESMGESHHSPAMFAASRGCIECLEILLEAGADLWRVQKNGASARSMAEAYGKEAVVAWLDAKALSMAEREALTRETPAADIKGNVSPGSPRARLRM